MVQVLWNATGLALSLFFLSLELVLFKLFPITEQDTTGNIAYSDWNILHSVQQIN